jgi:hypothetical protein
LDAGGEKKTLPAAAGDMYAWSGVGLICLGLTMCLISLSKWREDSIPEATEYELIEAVDIEE